MHGIIRPPIGCQWHPNYHINWVLIQSIKPRVCGKAATMTSWSLNLEIWFIIMKPATSSVTAPLGSTQSKNISRWTSIRTLEVRGREGGVGDLPVEWLPPWALARRLRRAEALATFSSRRSCNRIKRQTTIWVRRERAAEHWPPQWRRREGRRGLEFRRHYHIAATPRGRRERGDGGGGLGCSPFCAEWFANFWSPKTVTSLTPCDCFVLQCLSGGGGCRRVAHRGLLLGGGPHQ